MSDLQHDWMNHIDGDWVTGGGGWIDIADPATGETIARHAVADAGDVDRAVQAAKRAHEARLLSDMRPIERGRMVQAMGRYLLDNIDEIARVLTLEQGKPLWESKIEIEGAALYFEYYGKQASTVEGQSNPLGKGYYDITELEPRDLSRRHLRQATPAAANRLNLHRSRMHGWHARRRRRDFQPVR